MLFKHMHTVITEINSKIRTSGKTNFKIVGQPGKFQTLENLNIDPSKRDFFKSFFSVPWTLSHRESPVLIICNEN